MIIFGRVAVTGGKNTRLAVERIHFQAGVIGQYRQAAGMGKGFGFENGVVFKGCAGFFRIQQNTFIGQTNEGYRQAGKNFLIFAEFVEVVGGNE